MTTGYLRSPPSSGQRRAKIDLIHSTAFHFENVIFRIRRNGNVVDKDHDPRKSRKGVLRESHNKTIGRKLFEHPLLGRFVRSINI